MDVSGKKAVVFGGTSGIGRASAVMLAEKGADVTILSRDPGKAGEMPAGVATESVDVRDEEGMAAVLKKLGPYDILISAATGGDRAIGPFLQMDMQGYRNSFDKLWGYANVVRYGAEHLTENGCIVLVSGAPARRCQPGQVSLSSVGSAIEAMARAVAPELAPRRINVMSPGFIDTPMVPVQGEERQKLFDQRTGHHMIPRAGTAEEAAKGVLFLVENDFVTGTIVDVDGGWLYH